MVVNEAVVPIGHHQSVQGGRGRPSVAREGLQSLVVILAEGGFSLDRGSGSEVGWIVVAGQEIPA